MSKTLAVTGNDAISIAMKQINPDVVAAYPITPQTSIVEAFSNYVANGLVDTEMITVESEHSAMSACVGAAAAGARVMTATSANGLALMWEILYIAASLRLPIVMPVANRALSGPINIHCDHSDSMGARDSGWIQLFSENAQEAYDNTIQAIRIAEREDVLLPVMVMLDGFIISHAIDRIETIEDEKVSDFIGQYDSKYTLIDVNNPITVGPFDSLGGYYFEHKRVQIEAMTNAREAIKDVGKKFETISGRRYEMIEPYMIDDAEAVIIVLGSTAGNARSVVDWLREENKKVGLVKLRAFRPFPFMEIASILKNVKSIGVLDRSASFGAEGGPVFTETRSAFYDSAQRPQIVNYLYGFGGREIDLKDIESVFNELLEIAESGQAIEELKYIHIRD